MYNEIDLDKIDITLGPPAKEPARQYYFIAKCREWVRDFEQRNGRVPNSCVTTFGCQMNARDSEKLSGILRSAGFAEADSEEADFVIYNTCTVRDNANQRVFGRLGVLNGYKKKNPQMKVALCGCMMQEDLVIRKLQKSYSFVDLVFGTHNLYKFAELLYRCYTEKGMLVDIWKDTDKIVEDLPVERKYPFKSGVNIMFGCNNFCSYCIVPYVRGRERSRAPEEILREIRTLAADGVKEVMLLGQNVNSYGKTLDEPCTFAGLLRQIEEIEGIERIRFMTSHPKDLSDELIEVMKHSRKICRHLHLPVQSGSTAILKKMNEAIAGLKSNPNDSKMIDKLADSEMEFHALLYCMSNNTVLERMVPTIKKTIALIYTTDAYRKTIEISSTESLHIEIYEAIRDREAERAMAVGRDHMSTMTRRMDCPNG